MISLGMFLGILGVALAANPGMVHQAWTWFWSLVAQGSLSRPPEALIGSAVLLFSLGVGTGIATAVLRLRLEGNRRKAAGDVLGAGLGAALVVITYFYGARALSGGQAIAAVAISFALLILASILLAIRWKLIPVPLWPPPAGSTP
jgi:peptidoglycan/LPS O-acetylase OafA/YrhL